MNILYPVFVLVALTICVTVRLGYLRYRAVRNQEVDPSYYQAYLGTEPVKVRIVARHLANLLEFPPLFYVACLLAFVTGQNTTLTLLLAWAYCGLRVVHSFIHLGPNVVIWRFRVFVLSTLVLAVLWAVLFAGVAKS